MATANPKLDDERRKIPAVDKRAGKVTLASVCAELMETWFQSKWDAGQGCSAEFPA